MATCGNTINDMLEDNEVIQVDREELQMGRPEHGLLTTGLSACDGSLDFTETINTRQRS